MRKHPTLAQWPPLPPASFERRTAYQQLIRRLRECPGLLSEARHRLCEGVRQKVRLVLVPEASVVYRPNLQCQSPDMTNDLLFLPPDTTESALSSLPERHRETLARSAALAALRELEKCREALKDAFSKGELQLANHERAIQAVFRRIILGKLDGNGV